MDASENLANAELLVLSVRSQIREHFVSFGVIMLLVSCIASIRLTSRFHLLWRIMLVQMNRPSSLAFFSIGAVVDFVFGCIKWHSILAGIFGIVCGLPLTGLLYLSFRARWNGDGDTSA